MGERTEATDEVKTGVEFGPNYVNEKDGDHFARDTKNSGKEDDFETDANLVRPLDRILSFAKEALNSPFVIETEKRLRQRPIFYLACSATTGVVLGMLIGSGIRSFAKRSD